MRKVRLNKSYYYQFKLFKVTEIFRNRIEEHTVNMTESAFTRYLRYLRDLHYTDKQYVVYGVFVSVLNVYRYCDEYRDYE